MIAAVYIPIWVPAAVICGLCLIPDFGGMIRRLVGRWRDRRLLDAIWRDEVGGGRPDSYRRCEALGVATATLSRPAAPGFGWRYRRG